MDKSMLVELGVSTFGQTKVQGRKMSLRLEATSMLENQLCVLHGMGMIELLVKVIKKHRIITSLRLASSPPLACDRWLCWLHR